MRRAQMCIWRPSEGAQTEGVQACGLSQVEIGREEAQCSGVGLGALCWWWQMGGDQAG